MTETEIYRVVRKAVLSTQTEHKWMRMKNAMEYLNIDSKSTFYTKAKLVGADKHDLDGTILWDMNKFDEYLDDHKEELV